MAQTTMTKGGAGRAGRARGAKRKQTTAAARQTPRTRGRRTGQAKRKGRTRSMPGSRATSAKGQRGGRRM